MSRVETELRTEMMLRDMEMKLFNIGEKKELKLTDIKYIFKVIDSCKTAEQRETAINWGIDVLARLSSNE